MTPSQKKQFEIFLYSETPLLKTRDVEEIITWVEKNIVSEDALIQELKTENTNLLNSLKAVGAVDSDKLKSALLQAVELIKQWRTKWSAASGKSKEVIEEIWHGYFESAEMEEIREVLGQE